jgi:hypothetical protein
MSGDCPGEAVHQSLVADYNIKDLTGKKIWEGMCGIPECLTRTLV